MDRSRKYSVDQGGTWSSSFSAVEGENSVLLRQVDLAGNASDVTSLAFTLDTAAPAVPVVGLLQDTGGSATDRLTNLGKLVLGGLESDGSAEYSVDQGITWNASFNAVEGANAVQVRQTDLAGNTGDAASFSFVLDTAAPHLYPAISTAQKILVNATGLTVSANAKDASGIAMQTSGLALDTSTAGRKFVTCSATDNAGNSATATVFYTVGYGTTKVMPAPGASYKRKATIPVSFQMVDAKGVISDAAAAGLASSIKVTLGTLSPTSVTYNKKTRSFSASVKANYSLPGAYTLAIRVTVGGVEVTTTLVTIKLT